MYEIGKLAGPWIFISHVTLPLLLRACDVTCSSQTKEGSVA